MHAYYCTSTRYKPGINLADITATTTTTTTTTTTLWVAAKDLQGSSTPYRTAGAGPLEAGSRLLSGSNLEI